MECRRNQLQSCLEGLKATDTPLVELNGANFSIGGYPDDPCIYYFIPWIAKKAGLSIDVAIDLFFASLLGIGLIIATACFLCIFKHWSSRLISVVALLLLTFVTYHYSDVYIAFFLGVTSTVPLFLLFSRTSYPETWKLGLSVAFSGLVIGYCNLIRSHSGTGALLFILSWVLVSKTVSTKQKLFSSLLLLVFTSLPFIHFNTLETKRDEFLSNINSNHRHVSISHTFWHPIYLGLGYLLNNYGIEWSDSIGLIKATSINPQV
jgi:hypothetical protein